MNSFTRKLMDGRTGRALEGLVYWLARRDSLRGFYLRRHERKTIQEIARGLEPTEHPPGVRRDRKLLGLSMLYGFDRGLRRGLIADSVARRFLHNLVHWYIVENYGRELKDAFKAEHGAWPPWFIVVSPGKGCNLHCKGCYANSSARNPERLDWEITDRIISEAKELWGLRFIVISGGEPMVYRSHGKGILDIFEKHNDCFFLMYTNGTLFDKETARRMAQVGNVTPAISVEGMEEKTDARRGKGVFQRVLRGMANLREAGVPFGLSMTATRVNYQEIFSDEFLDFFFEEQGALYGWIFQYMPIGRGFTLELMPTPEQRVWMLRRMWEVVRQRKIFLIDFWNSGPSVFGCLAAGKESGYLYFDWNGKVMPCVFYPYSPVNVLEVYKNGGNLMDVWSHPFFEAIRRWQYDYTSKQGNWLMPCAIRDHHEMCRRLLETYHPEPEDEMAAAALQDEDYHRGLVEYDRRLAELTEDIWRREYLDGMGKVERERVFLSS